MSSIRALRRSPKAGAFTAAMLSVPRSLLTRGSPALPFHVFRDDQERLAGLGHFFEMAANLEIADLLLVIRM